MEETPRDRAGAPVPPPALMVIGMGGAVLLARHLPGKLALAGPGVRVAGAVLGALALTTGFSAVIPMWRAKTSPNPHRPTRVILGSGVFSVTRNPIYVSMALLIVASGLLAGTFWGVPLALLFALVINATQIPREERYLEGKFGADYADYKKRVRRWI